MNYYKKNIKNVRGDTYSIGLTTDLELDTIFFTCRDSLNENSSILFQKGLGNGITLVEEPSIEDPTYKYSVRVAPTDTDNIQAGVYYYDLQITINNDVLTIMKGKFIIEQDATRGDEPAEEEIIVQIKAVLDEINGETVSVNVFDKLDYLNTTKTLIKDNLNTLGAELTSTDTFRSYVEAIENIYVNYPRITDEGTEFSLNTIKAPIEIDLKGNIEQTTYTGKNLFDKDNGNILNAYIQASSQKILGSPNDRVIYISCQPNTAYTISKSVDPNSSRNRCRIGETTTTPELDMQVSNFVYDISIDITPNYTYTTSSSAQYLVVYIWTANGDLSWEQMLNSIQIEKGSTATDYEPYVGGTPSPNPEYPQEIKVVTGNNTIQISDGTNTQSYPITLGDIELCKIGDYQDYLYKDNDKWYKHNAIGKVVLDGSESGWNKTSFAFHNNLLPTRRPLSLCSHFSNSGNDWASSDESYRGKYTTTNSDYQFKCMPLTDMTIGEFKAWLSSNNVTVYCQLATATDTEITDETLISQLEALKDAYSYNGTTNISSEYSETNAPFIISASALMKGGN